MSEEQRLGIQSTDGPNDANGTNGHREDQDSSTASASAPHGENHAGLAALCAIARFHQIAADPANLAHQLGLSPSSVVSTQDLLRAAKHLGLKAKLTVTTQDRLALTPLPALALVRTPDGSSRTVILAQTDGQRVLLQDPSVPGGRPTIEGWTSSPSSGPAS